MKKHHKGIHHITALSGDARRNADFYVKSLGMRMVKKSVNQDDPGYEVYEDADKLGQKLILPPCWNHAGI